MKPGHEVAYRSIELQVGRLDAPIRVYNKRGIIDTTLRPAGMLLVALGVLLPLGALLPGQPPDPVHLTMRTSAGVIELEVDSVRAPLSAANFLRYVDAQLYAGGTFYRSVRLDNQPDDSVRIEVVQGGMNRERREEAFPSIPLEGTASTGLAHRDGVISMARGAGANTARSAFFICIGDQPELDEGGSRHQDGLGFAAFGRVVRGMDVVRAIQAGATDGQTLVEPVQILEVVRDGR
ncbi:MAG: peptidylprolyl isomerase [Longimicrobiales bacterium]